MEKRSEQMIRHLPYTDRAPKGPSTNSLRNRLRRTRPPMRSTPDRGRAPEGPPPTVRGGTFAEHFLWPSWPPLTRITRHKALPTPREADVHTASNRPCPPPGTRGHQCPPVTTFFQEQKVSDPLRLRWPPRAADRRRGGGSSPPMPLALPCPAGSSAGGPEARGEAQAQGRRPRGGTLHVPSQAPRASREARLCGPRRAIGQGQLLGTRLWRGVNRGSLLRRKALRGACGAAPAHPTQAETFSWHMPSEV